ncbi:MAG TPA: hypothetical protein VN650_16090 [Gemmatimonadaceae bacterium]|nr:hypothetical protein [Gemmatimonadaceae bacterium]
MTGLFALWLPILLSAVIVFIASALIHTVLPWHKGDYRSVANEEQVSAALRQFAIPPGDYILPRPASGADLKSPEFLERVRQGPNIVMTVLPNAQWSMGRNLGLWFLYCLIVSILAAWLTGLAAPPGSDYHAVFHFVAITAFIGYAVALWQMSIWWRRSWMTTFKATIDGIIYALLTAGAFAWLWPR